jgi:CRISPR-associated endoribonuclease Cas6
MQIKISFESKTDIILPIHYNHILQAFIYNNIDEKLASFLHNKGFVNNGRSFKLFTFSRILNRGKRVNDNFNFGNKINIIVSSPIEDFCSSIANYMLQREDLHMGKNNVKVNEIQILNYDLDSEEIVVEALSPIVVYSTFFRPDKSKYTCYFTPLESDFSRIVSENLIRKYNALNNTNLPLDSSIKIIPNGPYKQNITYYKDILIKGVSGKFIIRGNKELLQLGVDAGLGSKNSQGFGCVRVL